MASYNRVVLIGNLTRDPELKQLNNGQAVCRLGLAVNRQMKNRQTGAPINEVCFIDIDVWGAQAESCRQYLQKGRPVLVEGRLKFDSWQDAEGQTRSKHSIVAERVVFLGTNAQAESDIPALKLSDDERFDELQEVAAAVKKPAAKPKAKKADAPFADEPPFQDDLPF
ncbi:single-stranded DNA-binding protein [Candidatus Dependentiae bacterium]|nr:single-stranded DNA-binding protein [Candidatus Dependentiae bacterium]